jgi:D-galactarolactone cycloisomerase
MEITDVRVERIEVPLDRPLGVSRDRSMSARGAAFVVVETDAGITGIGEGVGPESYIVERIVEEKYAPKLIGEDPLDIERHWQSMVTDTVYKDRKGQGLSAASGVDIALWDVAGKHHGVPVYDLLGGPVGGDLKPYASDLFWQDPETMAQRAGSYVDRGFAGVKTHLGRGMEADEERVAAMRDAIGPDTALMVDMNCGYDRPEARRIGRMLEDYGVYWYEEPLTPYDVDGLADLRRDLSVPIATGENEYTKWGFHDVFEADAADYVMPDVMRCGGITEAKKICALAETYNTVCSPHCFTTGVGLAATMHVMAASPACEWLEFDPTDFEVYEPLFETPPELDDGRIALPEEPGLGVSLDEDVIGEFRVD